LVLARPAPVLLIAAAVLLAPSLVLGMLLAQSSHLNLIWAQQFAEQFRAGILYPRWLPDSFDGLGAPTFYFYPPLAFWIDAFMSVVTFDALPVSYRLPLTWLLLLWSSALAMHAWLARETGSRTAAVWGSLAYMIAPYHVLDVYVRGALAEFTTFAVLPLIALAIRLMSERRRAGFGLLVVAFAALLLSHLPTALLASATMIPLYVLFRAWRLSDRRAALGLVVRCAFAGALAIGLAAPYLLPAAELQRWISAELFWTDYYRVENWLVVLPGRWVETDFMRFVTALVAAYGLATVGFFMAIFLVRADNARRLELGFWAALCGLVLLLLAGFVPWFWQLPEIAKVQFPFRMIVIVEFAAITALCLTPLGRLPRSIIYVFAAALAVLVYGLAFVGRVAVDNIALHDAWISARPSLQETTEYQPAGYPHPSRQGGFVDPNLRPLEKAAAIDCTPAASVCRAQAGRFGAMRLHVESSQPTTVVLRRFYFPAWQVEALPAHQPVASQPTDPLRLVSFVAPAGSADFQLVRVVLPAERWGWWASGLSLALLVGWAAARIKPRRAA
jgi:hypothetical protein